MSFLFTLFFSFGVLTKLFLFHTLLNYANHGTIPKFLLDISCGLIYYYSKLELLFIKSKNNISLYIKNVPFLNNLLTYMKNNKCTFTKINDNLTICNKYNEEQNINYKIIINFKMRDWEYKYFESIQHKQADYKFIMTEIMFDDNKFLIHFTRNEYNYLIVNNKIDKYFINYFLKKHYNDFYKDFCDDSIIEKYTIKIVDHNVNIVEFDSSKTLLIKQTDYEIL